jgi:16S rRNA (adenine1518-N6/adenine1519-N6)-dimethyltransferase
MTAIRTKKSLGQHFLRAGMYLRAVADAAGVQKSDTVLEVGPGEGTLTRELLSRGARIIAVEKDDRLIPILAETFAREIKAKQLKLVHGDILKQDFKKLGLRAGAYKVAANIPYYISGALMRLLFEHLEQPSVISLLVQKEVAERIARSKKESLLSLSVKAYGKPTYVMKVPRGAFVPPPKVDSAILAVDGISRKNFKSATHEKKFFALIHAGFAHKRKKLGKAVAPLIGDAAREVADKRAEDIPMEVWLELAR